MCLSNTAMNHKAESVQNSLRQVLERKSREADEELKILKRENLEKEKALEKETARLHHAQQQLKQEQISLKSMEQGVQKISVERQILEGSNKRMEGRVKYLHMQISEERSLQDELKRKQKKEVMKQIYLSARHKKQSVEINKNQLVALHGKEKIRKLQEAKSSKDLYLEKLQQDVIDLEQKVNDYNSQLEVMQSHTNEMKEIVISTDKESEKVRHEKVVIMSRWKTSINKVSRKDEMLLRLREALKLLRLESKGVKAILGGVGSEIEEAKEQHKQLLESCNKTEKLCEQRNMQIQMVERQITEVKFQLEKSKELLMITNESLKSTNIQLRMCASQCKTAQSKIEAQQTLQHQLENKLLLLTKLQEGTTKKSQNKLKAIHQARKKAKELEEKIAETQNSLAGGNQEVIDLNSQIESQNFMIKELETKLKGVREDIKKLFSSLEKAQLEIDKKQNFMEMKHKDKVELVETGQVISPLEAEIHKIQGEIENAAKYCSILRQSWLKLQNECILLLNDRSSERSDLMNLVSKEAMLMEQNKKQEEKNSTLSNSVIVDLKRKIEALHGSIERLEKSHAEEKERHSISFHYVLNRRENEIEKIQQTLENIQAVKNNVEQTLNEIMNEKQENSHILENLARMDADLKKISEFEISDELVILKQQCENLQFDVDTKISKAKTLVLCMVNFINRRDNIVEKAATIPLIMPDLSYKIDLAKSLIVKKIAGLNKRILKMMEEEQEIAQKLETFEKESQSQKTELENQNLDIQQTKSFIKDLRSNIDEQRWTKNNKINLLLQNRRRIKWCKAILDNAWNKKLKSTSEDDLKNLLTQKKCLEEMLTGLLDQFPQIKKSILNVIFTFLKSTKNLSTIDFIS